MVAQLRSMLWGCAAWLMTVARGVRDFAMQTHAARLCIMARLLWRKTPLPAMLLLGAFLLCLYFGWSTGRGAWTALLPASPTGIGAAVAAVLAGLAVLELTAAFGITLVHAGLQLAYDTGRHRVLTLLAIASASAVLGLIWRLADLSAVSLGGTAMSALLTAGVTAMTVWFERAYLRPAYPGFRDFWADIVDARHFLNRAAHGE